ncbi:CYTH-like domain-containing protein [Endogone sp. FLAS-F59071]|nr:CYTH-like domain-containing protein [Endogone sp. FLAS-F59071]|eukprot:RUS15104.1 CYTH-like domain-containing protein [Endogone sp. FLAS-F59071]
MAFSTLRQRYLAYNLRLLPQITTPPIRGNGRGRFFSSSGPVHNEHFEVERKFRYDPALIPVLKSNQGEQLFKSVQFLRERRFTDIYYDNHSSDYPLTTQDVWFRQRDGVWQCKVPTGLATSMDSYRELTQTMEIADFLDGFLSPVTSSPTPPVSSDPTEFERYLHTRHGLSPYCTISTTRQCYLLDDEFSLDLDAADFGHHVGEMELVVYSSEQVREAERRIASMCLRHQWFFDVGDMDRPIIGKLSGYISRFNTRQWELMGKSTVLKKKIETESNGLDRVTKEVST